MKKLTILALTAVASAAFIFTGCPHTADDFKEGETYDLITYAEPYSTNWGNIVIPASSFANMTTTNNAQRITMEYELSESYGMVRFHYNPDSGWVNYDGKYYDLSDDTIASANKDGYVGPKAGVYITPNDTQLARLKKEGLAIQVWGVKVSKVTATYIGEKAEEVIIIDTDFTGALDGTLSGDGKIVADDGDPTLDVLAVTGSGKAPLEEDNKKIVYAFSGTADLSAKKKMKIVYHVKDGFKNGYAESGDKTVVKYPKETYLLTEKALTVKNYKNEDVNIPVGVIYNKYGKPESDFWVYSPTGIDTSDGQLYYGVSITDDDKNWGISKTSGGTALGANDITWKDDKLAIILYTDDKNYFIKYIETTGNNLPTSFDDDSATTTLTLSSDFTTIDNSDDKVSPDFKKIAGVKVFMNSCKGTLYIKNITFE